MPKYKLFFIFPPEYFKNHILSSYYEEEFYVFFDNFMSLQYNIFGWIHKIFTCKRQYEMAENLNNGEKEFMELFKHYKNFAENNKINQSAYFAKHIHEYMSPPNYNNLQNILKSLESKGLIRVEDKSTVTLTQLGEDYLWRN
jgi:hypothetical protein